MNDAKLLIKEAFNNCKDEDNECINTYMRNIQYFQASLDKINIHQGNTYRTAYVNEIRNDEMHVIVKVH